MNYSKRGMERSEAYTNGVKAVYDIIKNKKDRKKKG